MPLFCHHTDTDMRESLARHFGALKKAILSLEQCYDALTNPTLLENLDPQFPDPRTYCSLETETIVNFQYLCQLDEKKLLFVGETDNRERICIKFVRQYSRAREMCGNGHRSEVERFRRHWWQMEDGYHGRSRRGIRTLRQKYSACGYTRTDRGALVELHQANLVHGDV